MDRPRVFIGSSVEGQAIAEHLQLGLDPLADCTIWHQGVFGLSTGTLETLTRTANEFDFAILVLTPDDLVHKRGEARNSPRDNVIFELGLFMGALGRERTFIVHPRDERIELPTDLAGVAAAKYGRRADGNLQAAVGPACTQIKTAIQNARTKRHPSTAASNDGTLEKVSAELKSLQQAFAAQTEHVRRMMDSLTSGSRAREAPGHELQWMEGRWISPEIGSTAYARIIHGELRFAYCYRGNDNLTGEYYDWRMIDGALVARFRWVDGLLAGYSYLERKGLNHLQGGWWLSQDIPEEQLKRRLDTLEMTTSEWIRPSGAAALPRWAEDFFDSIQEQRKNPR